MVTIEEAITEAQQAKQQLEQRQAEIEKQRAELEQRKAQSLTQEAVRQQNIRNLAQRQLQQNQEAIISQKLTSTIQELEKNKELITRTEQEAINLQRQKQFEIQAQRIALSKANPEMIADPELRQAVKRLKYGEEVKVDPKIIISEVKAVIEKAPMSKAFIESGTVSGVRVKDVTEYLKQEEEYKKSLVGGQSLMTDVPMTSYSKIQMQEDIKRMSLSPTDIKQYQTEIRDKGRINNEGLTLRNVQKSIADNPIIKNTYQYQFQGEKQVLTPEKVGRIVSYPMKLPLTVYEKVKRQTIPDSQQRKAYEATRILSEETYKSVGEQPLLTAVNFGSGLAIGAGLKIGSGIINALIKSKNVKTVLDFSKSVATIGLGTYVVGTSAIGVATQPNTEGRIRAIGKSIGTQILPAYFGLKFGEKVGTVIEPYSTKLTGKVIDFEKGLISNKRAETYIDPVTGKRKKRLRLGEQELLEPRKESESAEKLANFFESKIYKPEIKLEAFSKLVKTYKELSASGKEKEAKLLKDFIEKYVPKELKYEYLAREGYDIYKPIVDKPVIDTQKTTSTITGTGGTKLISDVELGELGGFGKKKIKFFDEETFVRYPDGRSGFLTGSAIRDFSETGSGSELRVLTGTKIITNNDYELLSKNKNVLEPRFNILTKTKVLDNNAFKTMIDTRVTNKALLEQRNEMLTKSLLRMNINTITNQKMDTLTKSLLRMKINTITNQKMDTLTKSLLRMKIRGKINQGLQRLKPRINKPKKIIIPNNLLESGTSFKRTRTLSEEEKYFLQTRIRGKRVTIGEGSIKELLKQGTKTVDETLRGSFRITDTSGRPIKINDLSYGFRRSKTNPYDIVEKESFRLSTGSELGEIKRSKKRLRL